MLSLLVHRLAFRSCFSSTLHLPFIFLCVSDMGMSCRMSRVVCSFFCCVLLLLMAMWVGPAIGGNVGQMQWPMYSSGGGRGGGGQMSRMVMGEAEEEIVRGRMLAGSNYYISYGSLSANRVPCPAGSGRSYYTPNCQAANNPVRPYTRGCTQITRCARG